MSELLVNRLEQNLFHGKEYFFKNFDFGNRCKNATEDSNGKRYNQFRNVVSHKINFTGFCLHRYHPLACELIVCCTAEKRSISSKHTVTFNPEIGLWYLKNLELFYIKLFQIAQGS